MSNYLTRLATRLAPVGASGRQGAGHPPRPDLHAGAAVDVQASEPRSAASDAMTSGSGPAPTATATPGFETSTASGGARIPEVSERREAFNIMLSMPTGTDARVVRQAAREFAKAELTNHRYVMLLHTHQANPHVHISVRAEGRDGTRLNPRKEDLERWRETFAEKLRDWGIEAEASSQATRGVSWRSLRGWERQPGAAARTRKKRGEHKSGPAFRATRSDALQAWAEITKALAASPDPADRKLSKSIVDFVMQTEVAQAVQRHRAAQRQAELPGMTMDRGRTVQRVPPEPSRGPDMSR